MSSFLVCGPHPVSSSNGFHYHVIFVYQFTKYIWFYPLRRKSNSHSTFVTFKQLVENYFTITIKTLYTDNGDEFLARRSFLVTHGITHPTTPPHTLEHNGYSERRHRHIAKTSLTLLHQASISLTVKPGKNSIFLKNGKTVICRYIIGGKSRKFLDLR